MAGTPTPNYQFPTYAETDTPNLAGAYNQAVNAIDAKIKEVADSVSSGGDVPDASSTTKGIAKLYDSATMGAGDQDDGGITPKAVKDYVDAKVATEQHAYAGTAPVVVDNGSKTISVKTCGTVTYDAESGFTVGTEGTVPYGRMDTISVYNAMLTDTDALNQTQATGCVPTVSLLSKAIEQATPTASTSVKGLVQLATSYTHGDQSKAATAKVINDALVVLAGSWPVLVAKATTPLTTEMLANLYVAPNGVVVYKAPTE